MKLKLKKPLVFIDLETTGVNVASDRIVEISMIKIHPNDKEEIKTLRINPEMHIPAEPSSIHGIYDEDIKDEPTFKEVAKMISKFLEGCDIAGYNSNKFDVPLLMEEFLRVDVDFDMKKRKFLDVQNIFHKMEKRTLVAAYKFYCKEELVNAHSAEADIKATYEVFKAQVERYEGQNFIDTRGNEHPVNWNDFENLADFSSQTSNVDFAGRIVYNDKGEEVFNFGKHKGKPVEEVLKKEPSYYNWMMKGDFPLYTKRILTNIKLRTFQK